jgi:hypothetical protein
MNRSSGTRRQNRDGDAYLSCWSMNRNWMNRRTRSDPRRHRVDVSSTVSWNKTHNYWSRKIDSYSFRPPHRWTRLSWFHH